MAYSSHVHVCRMLGSLQIGWISHAVKHAICIQLGSPARGLYHAKCTENNGIRGFYARDCCIEFFTKSIEIVWIFYRPRLEKRFHERHGLVSYGASMPMVSIIDGLIQACVTYASWKLFLAAMPIMKNDVDLKQILSNTSTLQ